jgi:uncharacterized DUF497 family protein
LVIDRHYRWDKQKNDILIQERGIGFEQIVMHIDKGDLVDIVEHHNPDKYPDQRILIVNVTDYIYLVPFVKDTDNSYYLKTIIPSRKATRKYLRGEQ